jgi:hypothetical protein
MTLKAGGLIGAFVAWPPLSGLDLSRTPGLACVRGCERCINQENPHPSFLSLAACRFFHSHIIRAHADHCTTLGDNIMEMWGTCQGIPLLDGMG